MSFDETTLTEPKLCVIGVCAICLHEHDNGLRPIRDVGMRDDTSSDYCKVHRTPTAIYTYSCPQLNVHVYSNRRFPLVSVETLTCCAKQCPSGDQVTLEVGGWIQIMGGTHSSRNAVKNHILTKDSFPKELKNA